MRETTALGAAIAAGLAVGLWSDFTELRGISRADGTIFQPKISREESARLFSDWEKAVQMSKGWVDHKSGNPVLDAKKKSLAILTGTNPARTLAIEFSFDDLDDADEEDLLLELKKIEIQKRLKKLRRLKQQ